MGKKSIKENKTMYQIYREDANLTRAQASEALQFITESRLEKLEAEIQEPRPEEILAMATAYKKPDLCNYYCSQECPIGQLYVPKVKAKDLTMITLEMLAAANEFSNEKDRLIKITADGEITPDEIKDFKEISENLEKMSLAIDSLNLWVKNTMASGKLTPEMFS